MSVLKKGKLLRQDAHLNDGRGLTAKRKSSAGGVVIGLRFGDEVDVLSVYGNGVNRDNITIQNAIDAIGSDVVTLKFAPGTWSIKANVTVPSTMANRIPAGVTFDVDSGITLTFSGPVIRDYVTWTSGLGTVTEDGSRDFTGLIDLSTAVLQGASPLVFEGATANAFETTFAITDPTADRTLTVPDADVDLGDVVASTNAGTLQNLGLASSAAANALTIALKTQALSDPVSTSPVKIGFRNTAAATGDFNIRSITGALDITVPSGATLGFKDSSSDFVWIYAIDNSGTIELAVSNHAIHDEGDVHDTVILDTSSDNISPLYSETVRTGVPIRLIGRATVAVTTAGTWTAAAAILVPFTPHLLSSSFRG